MKEGIVGQRNPRICMFTERGYAHNAFRCGFYEGQDVLSEVDDVDLIWLKPGKAYNLRERLQEKIVWHDFTNKIVSNNFAFQPVNLNKEYDLFIAYCTYYKDLIHIPAIRGWKDHCKTSICWIDELWAADVPRYKPWMAALNEFDHVVLGLQGTVKAVSDAIKKTCHYVPGAVDAIRFSPYPNPPKRAIDFYSIGRIWEGLHRSLLHLAAKNEIFYVYDTFLASDTPVKDHRKHRDMLANFSKRSRYFFVAPGKMDLPEVTKGQSEIGFRYYEASAAGAVMLGQIPICESFRTMFDWQDAVIEIKPDGSDIEEVLKDLSAQPERLMEISRRNAVEALLRHDWVYRWKKILDIAGLKMTEEMENRENRLKQIAELARNGE